MEAPPNDTNTNTTDEQRTMEEVLAELDQFRVEAADILDRLQRSQAEFANFRRRIEQEREIHRARATEDLLRRLLPVADDFDRALLALPDDIADHPWIEGIRLVERKLMNALESSGVTVMESVGQPFDPSRHEAIMAVEGDGEADTVVEEYQRGYYVQDQVLRPAMVKVGPANSTSQATAAMDA